MDAVEIERLIFELYHNPATQQSANRYLTLAQVSKDAWTFSWEFLDSSKPIEVQYFGASSLHIKISRFWPELDNDENKQQLRNKLLETLVRQLSTEGASRVVTTRLCVALAAYCVHSITEFWPSAIEDLIVNLNPDQLGRQGIPAPRALYQLVELLMIVPEEFNCNYMSAHERTITRCALTKSSDAVFAFIEQVLRQQPLTASDGSKQQTWIDIRQAAIKCFANWTQHLGSLILGDSHERLLDLVLQSIATDDDLISYAAEAIATIYTHPEISKYPNTVIKLLSKLVLLEPRLDRAVTEHDQDDCVSLYNLFIQVGEGHSRLMLDTIVERPEHTEMVLKLITFILRCSASPGCYPVDETCSEAAFNFWYTFQDDIIGSPQERIPIYLSLFNPIYQTLIETLLLKVQYPPDATYDSEWSADDKETHRCYRQDIGDAMMYCYNMLRTSMLATLQAHFNLALANLSTSIQMEAEKQIEVDQPWQHLEAVIYGLSSIAENVESDEDVFLSQIFQSLPQIPFTAVKSQRLLSTTMEMLGSYSEWIYSHPDLLPNVLSLLLLGLKGQSLAVVSATMSLKDITRECQKLIQPYSSQILSACEESFRNESQMKPKEKARLMCTVGQVLTLLPYDMIISYLNQILPPILSKLELSIHPDQINSDNKFRVRNEAVAQLNILAMLFSSLDPEYIRTGVAGDGVATTEKRIHPLYPVFERIFPLLANIGGTWINDEQVMETLSECLKKAIITLLDEVKPMLMNVLQLTNQLYQASFQQSLLDIIKQLLTLFNQDAETKPTILACFAQMTNQTIAICSQDIANQTCLVEYYFTIAYGLLKKQPDIYYTNSIDCVNLFKLAMAGILLHERPSVKACASFLAEFINKSREAEHMAAIVNTDGSNLVNNCFLLISGVCDSPRNVVEYGGDILIALNQKYFDNLTRWLGDVVARDNFPTDRVTRDQKEQFCRNLLRERKSKRKLKELCNELSLSCRGLSGLATTGMTFTIADMS